MTPLQLEVYMDVREIIAKSTNDMEEELAELQEELDRCDSYEYSKHNVKKRISELREMIEQNKKYLST